MLLNDGAVDHRRDRVGGGAHVALHHGQHVAGAHAIAEASGDRLNHARKARNDVGDAVCVESDLAVGGNWIVTRGLADGDRLIVSNFAKARPGMPVKIASASAATPASSSAKQ